MDTVRFIEIMKRLENGEGLVSEEVSYLVEKYLKKILPEITTGSRVRLGRGMREVEVYYELLEGEGRSFRYSSPSIEELKDLVIERDITEERVIELLKNAVSEMVVNLLEDEEQNGEIDEIVEIVGSYKDMIQSKYLNELKQMSIKIGEHNLDKLYKELEMSYSPTPTNDLYFQAWLSTWGSEKGYDRYKKSLFGKYEVTEYGEDYLMQDRLLDKDLQEVSVEVKFRYDPRNYFHVKDVSLKHNGNEQLTGKEKHEYKERLNRGSRDMSGEHRGAGLDREYRKLRAELKGRLSSRGFSYGDLKRILMDKELLDLVTATLTVIRLEDTKQVYEIHEPMTREKIGEIEVKKGARKYKIQGGGYRIKLSKSELKELPNFIKHVIKVFLTGNEIYGEVVKSGLISDDISIRELEGEEVVEVGKRFLTVMTSGGLDNGELEYIPSKQQIQIKLHGLPIMSEYIHDKSDVQELKRQLEKYM